MCAVLTTYAVFRHFIIVGFGYFIKVSDILKSKKPYNNNFCHLKSQLWLSILAFVKFFSYSLADAKNQVQQQ